MATFEPVYYADRIVRKGPGDSYEKNKLNVINPNGNSGIVTLWTDPMVIWNKLQGYAPDLFDERSPLVALSPLYGNGLGQMLANLVGNPQIRRLAVTGGDTKTVPSSEYLDAFLRGDVTPVRIGEYDFWRLGDTQFTLDAQLTPDMFRHLDVKRFDKKDLEGIVDYVSNAPSPNGTERRLIELREPVFDDFPSDRYSHSISAKTPLKAWMEVMYHIDRFGENVQLQKGVRRALHNLDVTIEDPSFESEKDLVRMGLDPGNLKAYRGQMLEAELPDGESYTYGNRMREHFGDDALNRVGERLREDPQDRHSLISLWDTRKDLFGDDSAPCFTDAFFVNDGLGNLEMTVGFRTHNASAAWLTNVYGLRAIQEYVAEKAGMKPGRIHLRSRWIGIDPENARTTSALELVKNHRKTPLDVHDPRGYIVVTPSNGQIVAEHHSSDGSLLRRYEGSGAKEIKDALRHDRVISNPDHATWIGYELARAHLELHGELPEL